MLVFALKEIMINYKKINFVIGAFGQKNIRATEGDLRT